MNNNVLRGPLLKTAAVLIFFLTMLSISMANPEATVFSSVGLIIMRSLQWLIGMTLAVLFCLALLIALFFGVIAIAQWLGIASAETLARMYAGFRETLAAWLKEAQVSVDSLFADCKKGTACER